MVEASLRGFRAPAIPKFQPCVNRGNNRRRAVPGKLEILQRNLAESSITSTGQMKARIICWPAALAYGKESVSAANPVLKQSLTFRFSNTEVLGSGNFCDGVTSLGELVFIVAFERGFPVGQWQELGFHR
jgi:hypothetical protein